MCSPIITAVRCVFARTISGMIDASITRKPSTPITRHSGSITERGSSAAPILQVPAACRHVSAAVILIGVFLDYAVPKPVFLWVTSVSLIGTLWTWGIIMVAHLGYRRAVREGRVATASFRMPGAPVVNWLVLAFLLFVTAMLWLQPDTRVALYVAPVWFGLLAVGYFGAKPQPAQAS